MQVNGKKAIVTGGGSGYGSGIAKVLKNAGAEVLITGRNEAKLKETAVKLGGKYVVADASSGADWDRVFAAMPDVDILVNNAGCGGKIKDTSEQSDEDILNTINTNLTGVLMGCARASRIMKEKRSGLIINISSVCALYAWPGWSIYTAAKAGISKFSHALYLEMRPFGVRVSCITPSWGQTGFNPAAGLAPLSQEVRDLCIAPDDMGRLVIHIAETPDNLAVPDVTLLPMVQEISPM